jgi:hypothetical protein
MQRSSLVPLLDQFSRSDFIFPNFPFAQLAPLLYPVTLGFDSVSITVMSFNLGDRSPPSSSSQLTPEQAALMSLQTQMQQLQAQLTQQAAAAAHPPVAISAAAPAVHAPAPAFRPKIKEPSLYAGDPQKIDGWLQELHQQFMWYRLVSVQDCISLATAHLRGPALDWWCSLGLTGQAMTSWDFFVASLRTRFQPVSTAAVARRQLDQLRQGPTQNVNDYVATFRRLLVAIPKMDEGDQMHCFVRGLRSAIANQVLIQRASNLTQAIEIATYVGSVGVSVGAGSASSGLAADAAPMELSNVEDLEDETEGLNTQALLQELYAFRAAAGGGARAPAGTPSSFRRGLPSVRGLSPQQVKDHMDKGTCFKCGIQGHQSRKCPKNKPEK